MTTAARELGLDTAVPHLFSRGHLDADSCLDGVRLREITRRNRSVRVQLASGGFHMKQADPSLNDRMNRDLVENEARILEAFHGYPSFRRCRRHAPGFVGYDPASGILVTRLVAPATTVMRLHAGEAGADLAPDVSTSAARVLARFHVAGRALVGRSSPLRPLKPLAHAFLDPERDDPRPDMLRAYHEYRGRAAEAGVIQRLKAPDALASTCLVHGDARWENYLVTNGGGKGRDLPLFLIDWELAHAGDPAYDVAQWLSEYYRLPVAHGLRHGAPSLARAFDVTKVTDEGIAHSARAFLEAYAGAVGADDAARADLFRRVRAHVPALLLLIGWEMTSGPTAQARGATWPAEDLIALAGRALDGGIPALEEAMA